MPPVVQQYGWSTWSKRIIEALAMTVPCPFCELPESRIRSGNQHGVVIRDGFPVSPGHTLIIPRRHVGSLFELDAKARDALMDLLASAREQLIAEHAPDGFNIGINDGAAAGQTVAHLHIHLIPRYRGDRADPRGGVRWIFPDKADYWSARASAPES